MTYFFHEEGNRLFSAHFSQMKTQGKRMRAQRWDLQNSIPKRSSQSVENPNPTEAFPNTRPSFHQKGCAKELTGVRSDRAESVDGALESVRDARSPERSGHCYPACS